MGSGVDLRLALTNLFEVVHENCLNLRASEIVRLQAEARERNELGRTKLDPAAERYPQAIALAGSQAFQDRYYPHGVDIVAVRALIREELKKLRSNLWGELSGTEVYEALFPITIHCDELIRTAAGAQAHRWEPLQSEMFDIEDGGEQFFSRLRALLDSEEPEHLFVYEAYYYCLSDGFGGRWRGNERQLNEYRNLVLDELAPKRPIVQAQPVKELEVEPVRSKWRYYALTILVIAAALVSCQLFASWWDLAGGG